MSKRLDKLLDRTQGLLVLLALVGTPLVFTAAAYEQFVRPKTVWAETLAALLLLLAGARALTGRRVYVGVHGVNLLMAAFFLWNVLMWPLAESRSLAAERLAWLASVAAISLAWQEWAGRRPGRVVWAAGWLAAAGALTASWALYQDATAKWSAVLPGWWPRGAVAQNKLGDWRGLITAGFGNTDHVAAFLALAYLPALLVLVRARGKARVLFLLIGLWLSAAALIVCWSVGNNAALILAALVLLGGIGHARRRFLGHRRRIRLIVWAAGCLLAVLWLATDNPLNPHRPGIFQEAFASTRWKAGGPTRGVIWLNTMEMIRRHQLTGVGPGCFTYVYPRVASEFMPREAAWLQYQGAYTNAAHNSLMQTWAELGPVGAFLLILMAVAAFRALAGPARRSAGREGWIAWGAVAALTVWCASSLMTFPLELPASTLLFFALLPLGEMLGRAEHERGFEMPAFVAEGRFAETVVHTRDMTRVTGVEMSFRFPPLAAVPIFLAGLAGCSFWIVAAARPLVSDAIYNRAHKARLTGDSGRAGALYRRALALYPNHHDCRSEYSDFLLQERRYQECVDQLEIVFRRLDSRELYLRRAQAYEGLGMRPAAARDIAIFQARSRLSGP